MAVNDGPFTSCDLPIFGGRIYHTQLKPEELSPNIIIVGDLERVPEITMDHLYCPQVFLDHRGLVTITGVARETDQRVTLVTSGMGTPSLEIVVNELVAANEINFDSRARNQSPFKMINIIHVGTSGALQRETELGTPIITDYVIGLDNAGMFYDIGYPDELCRVLEERVHKAVDDAISLTSRFKGKIFPYVSRANPDVVKALEYAANQLGVEYKKGITTSNSGFFANQGRHVSRVPLTVPDIDGILAKLDTGIPGQRIENMEMEASFLAHFLGGLGYRAGIICPGIANRREGSFAQHYAKNVSDATKVALLALYELRKIGPLVLAV